MRLLHVTLDDAQQLLGCVSNRQALRSLFQLIFGHRWCYRPEEMTEPRNVTDAATGRTTLVDVCVWGFEDPEPPPQCGNGRRRASGRL